MFKVSETQIFLNCKVFSSKVMTENFSNAY